MKTPFFLSCALVVFLAVSSMASAVIIDTTPYWSNDPITYVHAFGPYNCSTYGQVITAPEPVLESFTFYMNQPSDYIFQTYVYKWDGSKITGSALWQSDPMSTTGPGTYEAITSYTGGINVTPGNQYVIFANVVDHYNVAGVDGGKWGFMTTNPYSGGNFVYLNNYTGNFNFLSQNAWTSWGESYDLAFAASFSTSTVPIPAAIFLFAPALGAVVMLRRKLFSRR
jgi:hypothetical protein